MAASDTTLASSSAPVSVRIAGILEPVQIPVDYSLLLELTLAVREVTVGVHLQHLSAAAMALCCPSVRRKAARLGIDYAKLGYSPLAYGRAVHNWFHAEGVTLDEIIAAGVILRPLIDAASFPSASEVDAELGKSAGLGA